jgi:hypothetical protein
MESLVSDIPAGDGKIANLFLQCNTHRKTTGNREGAEETEGMRKREGGEGAGSVKVEGCGWRKKEQNECKYTVTL